MIISTTILTSCVKLLLIPAYRSTDFEVHRNWLAITNSLPLKKWYFDETSEWTLDYPPLFAYFEYILSILASMFDKNMLIVDNINYMSKETVMFQRMSVILTDLVYAYGAYKCSCAIHKGWRTEVVLPILLITNCGLLMVDHVHFQYNGVMYGILLLSIAYMLQSKYLKSAFYFTVLINMKHIYIYLAPAYFVYLLKNHCLRSSKIISKQAVKDTFILGSIVIGVLMFTFVPFYNQLGQVLTRMFPFKRGLCHAYWAPNFWAIYNTVDKAFYLTLTKTGLMLQSNSTASMTGGLVQEFSHEVLPSIKPIVAMLLSITMMVPALMKLWTLNKQPANFLRCLVLCALTSFLFGWHVHEKAILMAIIPISILAVMDSRDASVFLLLGIVGHYSLFPLLFPNSLIVIKGLLLVLYSVYAFHSLSKIYSYSIYKYSFPLLSQLESLYIIGLIFLFFYENVVHYALGLHTKFPYLPLLLTSLYCSIGVVYSWIKYYVYFLKITHNSATKANKVKST